ncbi:MAG: hypothetical protein AMJ78_10235 [Omnitrophica WOR_2 bacterium SM23_29]|nr:MAG: hypothetical protein AMJ78_10235 [Omnitrophica WOR_2 bacterium SM23_29]
MAEEFSPEEKLLKLIRGEKKHKDKSAAEKAESLPSPTEAPSTGIQYDAGTAGASTDERKYFKFVNLALIIILIITVGFFIFEFVSPKFKGVIVEPVQEPLAVDHKRPPQAPELPTADHEIQTPPFSTYAEVIGRRDLFKPQQPEVPPEKSSEKTLEAAYNKLNDLSLIGIIAGEKPQAVIEDRKNQKTYFLYKGQTVNQMRVEDILGDRVIFIFEGERFELSL